MIERDVETKIDEQLIALGWVDNPSSPNRNVYKQSVKTGEQKKNLQGKRPDYVLYKENTSEPLIVIEAKSPKHSISRALEQCEEYARAINAPIAVATNGTFTKTLHIRKQKPLFLNKEEVDRLLSPSMASQFVDDNEYFTIDKKVIKSREELLTIFKDINEQFRDAGVSTGLPRIELFCNLLFLKVITELSASNSLITELPDWCKWDRIKQKKGEELYAFINGQAFEHFQKAYGGDVLSPIEYLVKPDILDTIVSKLNDLHLSATNTDIKGDAFEYFLRNYGGADTDFGEYFTPRHIVKALVQLLNPQFGERIYDPFCGTGGMLIEAYKHIYESRWAKTSENIKILKEQTIYGAELTKMYRIAKMNMILAGDGHSNIIRQDSYATPDTIKQVEIIENGIATKINKTIKYDVVITNMPFGRKMKTEHSSLYGFDTKSAEIVGVLHSLGSLNDNENARLGIIVPEGILFNSNIKAYKQLRELVIRNYELETVVSLPSQSFAPNTGVKSDMLIIKKRKQSDKNHVWYFNVKNDGYTLDTSRRKIDGVNDIDNLLSETELDIGDKGHLKELGFSVLYKNEITKNNFKFLPETETPKSAGKYPLVKLKEVVLEIKDGGTPPRKNGNEKNYFGGSINWCVVKDVKPEIYSTKETLTELGLKKSSARVWEAESIIISLGATIGNVGIAKIPMATKQGLSGIVVDKSKILPKFLYYILDSRKKEIQEMATGTTIKEVRPNRFIDTFQIPLPTLQEQQQIVNELENYQRIVTSARTIVESYKPIVNYSLEWKLIKLKDVCSFSGGTQPPKNTFKYEEAEGYIRLLQIRDYKNDDFATYIPIKSKHKTCNADDIMIGRYGPPVFQILRGKSGAYNVALIKCIPDNDKITNDWLFYFLNSTPIQDYIIGISTRARQSGVSPTDLGNLDIPLPPLEIQQQLGTELKKENALIEQSQKTIELFTKKIQDKINYIFGMG
ncbi:MAG: N-6 DNA methylase [Defluviitaleaceae bacterium]|nr:N-6 DNA methylase [Defluviitaleaceae bacterium]